MSSSDLTGLYIRVGARIFRSRNQVETSKESCVCSFKLVSVLCTCTYISERLPGLRCIWAWVSHTLSPHPWVFYTIKCPQPREPTCSPLGLGETGGGAEHLGGLDQKEWSPLPCGFFYTTSHCILPTYSYNGCEIKHLFQKGTKSWSGDKTIESQSLISWLALMISHASCWGSLIISNVGLPWLWNLAIGLLLILKHLALKWKQLGSWEHVKFRGNVFKPGAMIFKL